jgi:hypothetical protein
LLQQANKQTGKPMANLIGGIGNYHIPISNTATGLLALEKTTD